MKKHSVASHITFTDHGSSGDYLGAGGGQGAARLICERNFINPFPHTGRSFLRHVFALAFARSCPFRPAAGGSPFSRFSASGVDGMEAALVI